MLLSVLGVQEISLRPSKSLKFVVILCFVDRASRYNRVEKNQFHAIFILSSFRQPVRVSVVSRPIIRRYKRMYTTIGTYYSFYTTVCCAGTCFERIQSHHQEVEWKRNVMAHAQKPDLVFQRNGRVHLYRLGCQFSRLLAAEVCASAVVMLDRPCSHTVHECWLPTPFASFPFTSPPVLRRVPSDSVSTLQLYVYMYVKVKWSRYGPGVDQRVGRGIALLFLDRGTRRWWVVSSTPRPHFTPGKDTVHILQEAGWAPGSVWTGGKSRPHWDSIPDRPARNQSLYRLSYRAHIHVRMHMFLP